MPSIEPAPLHRERDLRAITADGVFFSVMVGLREAYVPAFALAAGLGEVVAGLVASVPMLAGAVLQLVTPVAVRRLGSYRRWIVICARLQALSFL
jgi:cyanate permease